jgi:hypothetical protein
MKDFSPAAGAFPKAPAPDDFKLGRPSQELARDLTTCVAQLRHAYAQLNAGTVLNQPEFARGLIAPQIEKIEKVLRRIQ